MDGGIDADRAEGSQVEFLNVVRRGFENDLQLEVATKSEGILAIAGIGGPARRLHEGDPIGLRSQRAQKRLRVHGSGADLEVVRLLNNAAAIGPIVLE